MQGWVWVSRALLQGEGLSGVHGSGGCTWRGSIYLGGCELSPGCGGPLSTSSLHPGGGGRQLQLPKNEGVTAVQG